MQYGWETIYSASMFFLLRPDPSSPNCSSTGTSRAGAKFLQSHHDKHPQFITLHYRNRKSNTYQRTNPDSNSYAPTMVRPLHNNNCGWSSAWPCYERASVCACLCFCVCMCVCVCGLTGAHILPEHQHGHLGDTHPFLNYLPAFLRAYLPSLILHSHQRRLCWRLWRPLCVTQGQHSLFFLHFPLLVTFLCANSLLHVWEMIWGEQTGDGI